VFRTCGDNSYGQLGNGSTSGNTSTPYTPNVGTGRITDIAGLGGAPNSIQVLKYDGTLYTFGYSGFSQTGLSNTGSVGTPTIATTGVTALLSDGITSHTYGWYSQSAILKSDGLYMCGLNDGGYCGLGNTASPITTFSKTLLPTDFTLKLLGSYCTNSYARVYVAVSTDNRIYAWGNNGNYGVCATSTTNVLTPSNINTPRG
jgi:alpha-tubulin suppressor-like RCC1 family protein